MRGIFSGIAVILTTGFYITYIVDIEYTDIYIELLVNFIYYLVNIGHIDYSVDYIDYIDYIGCIDYLDYLDYIDYIDS